MEKETQSLEEWKAGFEGLTFEQQAERIKDKILESDELDDKSRNYFSDAFNYVMTQYKMGKPLDTNLMRIHMTNIKNYEALTIQDFTKTLIMLSLCGFQFDFKKISPDS